MFLQLSGSQVVGLNVTSGCGTVEGREQCTVLVSCEIFPAAVKRFVVVKPTQSRLYFASQLI